MIVGARISDEDANRLGRVADEVERDSRAHKVPLRTRHTVVEAQQTQSQNPWVPNEFASVVVRRGMAPRSEVSRFFQGAREWR